MKILVSVKRVIDYNVKVRVREDLNDVDLSNTKMALNPFCEIAVEEAVKLNELLKVELPAEHQSGIRVASVEELVDKLKNEAKVI